MSKNTLYKRVGLQRVRTGRSLKSPAHKRSPTKKTQKKRLTPWPNYTNQVYPNVFDKEPPKRQLTKYMKQYDTDGYTIIRGVIDMGLIGEMNEHLKYLQRRYPDVPSEHLHHHIMRNDPFWVRVVSDARLIHIGQSFLSTPNLALFSSHYFSKPPLTGLPVEWHQDASYWPLKPMNVLTAWLAVDPSNEDNGCLRVVRGSHRTEAQPLIESEERSVLGSYTHNNEDIDQSQVVDIRLNPGDLSIHHPNIVHASNANNSARRRCGLTIRYMDAATECTDADQPVLLLRGRATGSNNVFRSWPPYRVGYDMPFRHCEAWNERRFVNPGDEAYFKRDQIEVTQEIRDEVLKFVDTLGG